MTAAVAIALLRADDRAEWEKLAPAKAFYETEIPQEHYHETWRLLTLGAK